MEVNCNTKSLFIKIFDDVFNKQKEVYSSYIYNEYAKLCNKHNIRQAGSRLLRLRIESEIQERGLKEICVWNYKTNKKDRLIYK